MRKATSSKEEGIQSCLKGIVDNRCPYLTAILQPTIEVKSVTAFNKRYTNDKNGISMNMRLCGISIFSYNKTQPRRRVNESSKKRKNYETHYPVIRDVVRRKPELAVIKSRQHTNTSSKGSGSVASDHRDNRKQESDSNAVQLTLQSRPHAIFEMFSNAIRDFVTKFRENALTKIPFYCVTIPKSLSKEKKDMVVFCSRRKFKGWKRATTADPNKQEDRCDCNLKVSDCITPWQCEMNQNLFKQMYYRYVIKGDEKVVVGFFADLNLTAEELCNVDLASSIYSRIRDQNFRVNEENFRLQHKVEEFKVVNAQLESKVAELERKLKLAESSHWATNSSIIRKGSEAVNGLASADDQQELVGVSTPRDTGEEEIQPGRTAKRPRIYDKEELKSRSLELHAQFDPTS